MAPEPAPAPDSASTWRRQVNNILETQIARYPFLVQMRAVWRQLQDERESWPILLPALAIFFFLVYRRERKIVAAIIRDVAD
jgi:hypothetical protein